MAAHPGSVPHSTPHGDAPTLGSGTFCPPHGPAVAALVQLLLLLVWTAPSICWFQHSLMGLALSSFPWGLHGNCFLCTCPRAWPVSPTLWGCPRSPAHHLHWNLNPTEMGYQQPSPQRSGKSKTPAVTPVPRYRNRPCLEHMELPQLLHPQSKQ